MQSSTPRLLTRSDFTAACSSTPNPPFLLRYLPTIPYLTLGTEPLTTLLCLLSRVLARGSPSSCTLNSGKPCKSVVSTLNKPPKSQSISHYQLSQPCALLIKRWSLVNVTLALSVTSVIMKFTGLRTIAGATALHLMSCNLPPLLAPI